jgi:sortase (surface protein transpeptidase)
VAPSAVWVTGPADGAWLTLTTCNPITRSIERLVVFARLIRGPNLAAVAAALTGDAAPPQPPGG